MVDSFPGYGTISQNGMIRPPRSRTGHPERRMNPRLLGLILSLSGMLLGIALLLVCMYFYAVPHVLTADFLPVTCTIASQMNSKKETLLPYCGSEGGPCIRQRSKRNKVTLTLDLPADSEATCPMVYADYVTLTGTQVHKAKVFLDPWTYYQVELDTNTCPCPHCNTGSKSTSDGMSQTLPVGGATYPNRHLQDCFYNPYNDQEVILEKLTPMLVLNAMLWPTILFISGFVGVFLSCIMR